MLEIKKETHSNKPSERAAMAEGARQTRQLRLQSNSSNENESEVTDPFAAGNYAGSFKLRFLGDGSTIHKGGRSKPGQRVHHTDPTRETVTGNATNQQGLSTSENSQPTEYVSEEACLIFHTPQSVATQSTAALSPSEAEQQPTSPSLTSHDQGPPESGSLQGTSVSTAEDTLLAGADSPPLFVAVTVISNPLTDNEEDGLRGDSSVDIDVARTEVIEQQHSGDYQVPDGALEFYPSEQEPELNKDFRRRAAKAIRVVVHDTDTPSRVTQSEKCCKNCIELQPCACPGDVSLPEFTPELKTASYMGVRMMKKLLFPAMPKVVRDLWVYAELGVTIMQFVLSVVSLSLENDRAFNVLYLVLSSINLILALIDGFIYFVQLGSCAKSVRWCRSKVRGDSEDDEESEIVADDNTERKWWQLSPKWKKNIDEWFELIRSILTELLIYPLLICDLFDFIVGGSLLRSTAADRINFALFIIGGFYLFLSVYFMRIFMVITSLITLRRIPVDASGGQQNYINLVTRFCMHILAQLVTHATIIIAIGLKILQENPQPCPDGASQCVVASPFLVYAAIAGGVIPFTGAISFFFVNYYQMRELAVGFWIDMLSLLQGESFADVVFQGEGVKSAKQKASKLADKLKLQTVKEQYKDVQSVPEWVKVFYPMRNPILLSLGIVYEILVISFIVCLLYTRNSDGTIEFILFAGPLTSGFFIMVVFLLIANYRVLILVPTVVVYIPVSAIHAFVQFIRNQPQRHSI